MKTSYKIITCPQPKQGCTEQPLTGLDIGNSISVFGIALVFGKPLNALQLIDGLQKSLNRIPYFSGRVFGLGSPLPLVIPNNEGVLFTSSDCDEKIPDFSIDQPLKPYISKFTHGIDSENFDHHTPLLQINLANFSDGSILGISISHFFCDGISMIEFMRDWASNIYDQGSPAIPCWNRRDVQQMAIGDGKVPSASSAAIELSQPINPKRQPVETCVVRLSVSLLEQLYLKYSACADEISRQDIVMAFIFILISRCRIPQNESCSLTITYNVRRVLGLSANYLGNAVNLLYLQLSAEQIAETEVSEIARLIRGLHVEMTTERLCQDLAFWQRRMAEGCAARFMSVATSLALNGGILINNMSKFNFYDLDFGGGKPVWLETPPPSAPISRGVLMLPAPTQDPGIDLHITLPHAEMINFRTLVNDFRSS